MIIVQNKNKDIIGGFTTLKLFLRIFNGNGASLSSYDHVRKRLADQEGEKLKQLKYKSFIITRIIIETGTREETGISVPDSVEDIEFKL